MLLLSSLTLLTADQLGGGDSRSDCCCLPSPQEAIQLDGEILYALLQKVSPVAHRHLRKHNLEPIMYMTEWFMCAFSRTLPWASVLRVWDMFLCEGETFGGHPLSSYTNRLSSHHHPCRLKSFRTVVLSGCRLRGKDPLPSGPHPPKMHAGLSREAKVLPRSL